MRKNFIIALICWGINLYIYMTNSHLIRDNIWFWIILLLFAIAGYNLGSGISKLLNEKR